MMHIQNKEKQPDEAWVRTALEKILAFDVEREKETFMEAKRDFVDPSTSVAPAQPQKQQSQLQEASTDKVSTLSSFLQSCMKLLRNQNALSELQKVIASYEPQQGSGQAKIYSQSQKNWQGNEVEHSDRRV